MSNEQKKDNLYYAFKAKKNVSQKTGKPFWKVNKHTYATDLIGFEAKDGSGDINFMYSHKDMDEVAAQRGQQGQPKNFAPRSEHPYAPKQNTPPPMPGGDDEDFGF